jgi:tetratricopeptide (TPR) repeat protein
VTLTGEDEARLARVPTKNTEAYTAYLIGRQRLTDRRVDWLEDAVEQFALAIELDPQFAGAYSGLADACYLYKVYTRVETHDRCPKSKVGREQLARKALELDPESGEAWISLGSALETQLDKRSIESRPKWREAIAAFERGLELNPNLSQGYHWYAMALHNYRLFYPDPPRGWLDAWKAGVWQSVYDDGLKVDPLSLQLHKMKTYYPGITRSKEEAIRHAQRMVEIAPDSPLGFSYLSNHAWNLNGRIDESIRWGSQALEGELQSPYFSTRIGRAYSALGDPAMALAYFDLARAYVAPENKSFQDDLLLEQAIIRLLSTPQDAQSVAELHALLSQRSDRDSLDIGVYVDLTMGQPGDALARFKKVMPECIGADNTPKQSGSCPIELARVYQALGDDAAVRDRLEILVQENKVWTAEFPATGGRYVYAQILALAGYIEEALDVLEEMVASDWRGFYQGYLRFSLCCDVTFDAIREHERFQAIVATIEADMAQQLENVREMQRRGEVPTLEEVNALIASNREGGGS